MVHKKNLIIALVMAFALVVPGFNNIAHAAEEPAFGIQAGYDVYHITLQAQSESRRITDAEMQTAMQDFRSQIDLMKENNLTWLRFGIVGWTVGGIWDNDFYPFSAVDTDGHERPIIEYYRDAIQYAKNQGLKIDLVLADGEGASSTDEEYRDNMTQSWQYIADHVASLTDMVQIYNEAQGYNPKTNSPVAAADQHDYWVWLGNMISVAGNIFKAENPNILVTTNTYGWPLSQAVHDEWKAYMDVVGSHLDVISMDLYADGDEDMQTITNWINEADARYSKPVFVQEFGRQGYKDGFSDDWSRLIPQQADMNVKMIQAIRNSKAMGATLYQLKDSGNDDSDGESNFGLLEQDGTRKFSFAPVMAALRASAVTPTDPTNPTNPNDGTGSNGNGSTTGSASNTANASGSANGSGSATLADTGSPMITIGAIAAGIVLLGGSLLFLATRRRNLLATRTKHNK